MKHLVLELVERDEQSVWLCDTAEEAIDCANELLIKHFAAVGDEADPDQEGEEWGKATEGVPHAWANVRNMNWDAHVVPAEAKAGQSKD